MSNKKCSGEIRKEFSSPLEGKKNIYTYIHLLNCFVESIKLFSVGDNFDSNPFAH